MENGYQTYIQVQFTLLFFAAVGGGGGASAVDALCKTLSISTAINNIVIIISTYRSYEYYSVCVLCAYIAVYSSACSIKCAIALHLYPYIGKCQQNI